MMPFRNMSTLEAWLEEFRSLDYPLDGAIRVMVQDGDEGANTGLVGVTLTHGVAVTYIQPESIDSPRWLVTFEPRDAAVELDSESVRALAAELTTVAALCAFLEARSAAYVGHDAP